MFIRSAQMREADAPPSNRTPFFRYLRPPSATALFSSRPKWALFTRPGANFLGQKRRYFAGRVRRKSDGVWKYLTRTLYQKNEASRDETPAGHLATPAGSQRSKPPATFFTYSGDLSFATKRRCPGGNRSVSRTFSKKKKLLGAKKTPTLDISSSRQQRPFFFITTKVGTFYEARRQFLGQNRKYFSRGGFAENLMGAGEI